MRAEGSSIDVTGALRAVPHFDSFCSVAELHGLVDRLSSDPRFTIRLLGRSERGSPIHHVRFGKGSVKALFVAFPHCNEPIGGLTVFGLLSALSAGTPTLADADVEWHVIPCIDPDGAALNEGWTQQKFSFDLYRRHFHKQEPRDQVEMSFPLRYKRLAFDTPVPEARLLQNVIDDLRPDFYCSLHNAWTGGGYFLMNRALGAAHHEKLRALLEQLGLPIQLAPLCTEGCARFGDGAYELGTTRKVYDVIEKTSPRPDDVINYGACSWEYLAQIKPDALSFVPELPYVRHPNDGSLRETHQSRRRLKLRLEADSKALAAAILAEWDTVQPDLASDTAFYRKIFNGVVSVRTTLLEGLPSSPYNTRDILFNTAHDGTVSEGERFNEHMLAFYLVCNAYEFVRLLKQSPQTAAIEQSTARLEALFSEISGDIERAVGFDAFETIDPDTLAKGQLGGALIALDAVLSAR